MFKSSSSISIIEFSLTALGRVALTGAIILGFRNNILAAGSCALASMVVLGARDVLSAEFQRHTRREQLRHLADRLGFSFRPRAACSVLGWTESFRLTRDALQKSADFSEAQSQGFVSEQLVSFASPQSTNVMQATVRETTVAIFDFERDVPGGTEDETWNQTVLAVKSAELDFSYFAIHPVTFWSKLVSPFLWGVKSHASLPEGYGFVGEDERVLQAIAPRLHSLLADQISIEAGEGFMLFYQLNKLVEPEGIERLIDIGLQIRRQLSSTKLNREKQTPDFLG